MRGMKALFAMMALVHGATEAAPVAAQMKLDDLEMAHVAVVASQIDIAYARIALAKSSTPAVRRFAETMINDHEAVNAQVAALAERLHVTAKDNPMSQSLLKGAEAQKAKLQALSGKAFDRAYLENELAYHQTVNGAVAEQFIPNIANPEVKRAFETALVIFRGHEQHVGRLVEEMGMGR